MDFPRGDTFEFFGPVTVKVNGVDTTDLTGWTAESQVRDISGRLLADLTVEWLSHSPAVVKLSYAGDTNEWVPGKAKVDIQFTTTTGKIVSTRPAVFQITQDVTREG